MKYLKQLILVTATITCIVFLSASCSSSKSSSTYPKRLQRSVKCSGCRTINTTDKDKKTVVIAYHHNKANNSPSK